MDPALALLKYYAARSVIRPVAVLGVPILLSEIKAGWGPERGEATWYAAAVADALAFGALHVAGRRPGPLALRDPAPPGTVPRRSVVASAPRLEQMARKASGLLKEVVKRHPSLARDPEVDPANVAEAAETMFNRAWPRLAVLLFRGRGAGILAPDPDVAFRLLDSCLLEALRDGGSPDEKMLEPGDTDSAGRQVTSRRKEPVVTGSRIKDLELLFALSERVVIAEHLTRTRALSSDRARRIALLFRGHGEASRNAKETWTALATVGFSIRSKGGGVARTARRAAEWLNKEAREAVQGLAPAAQDLDPRAALGQGHAQAILDLLPADHKLRREPKVYQNWLRTYRADAIPWRQEAFPDHVLGLATAGTEGAQTPTRVPDALQDNSTADRLDDPVAWLVSRSGLTVDEMWTICVRWARENYPFEDPPDELAPVQDARNQVAMLLGMPELLLPNTLPAIRALAESKRRDGHHTPARWGYMSRLLGEPVGSLQAAERQLQARLALALQTWQPPAAQPDDGEPDDGPGAA